MTSARILIVEGQNIASKDLEERLKTLGYDVSSIAFSGEAATQPVEQALQQRNQELALLNRLGQELAATLDLRQVVEKLLPTITETIGAEGASVWLWDEEREDELVCWAMARGQNITLVDLHLRPDQGIAGWVCQTGRSAIVSDVQRDPRFFPGIDQLVDFRTISLLAVPLGARGKVIGVLEVVNKLQGDFSEDDLALVEMLATSAGIAIDNARLFRMLQQRNRELAVLNQSGQALSSILELDQILTTVLEEVCHLLGVTASSLWLIDPDTGELVCRQATGPGNDIVRGWRLPAGEGIAGWVARTGQSVMVPDSRADARHFGGIDQQTKIEMRSILSVPLRLKQDVKGALQMVDEKINHFKPTDLMLLESLAATAAIAIENARLYEQAQKDTNAKSALLHEVNHRVKNNLSAIIGILYAERQHAEIKDQAVYQSIMQDLITRVQGLATVHNLLSSSEWAPPRLSDLAARIIHSSLPTLPRDKRVTIEVPPSPIQVTPDQAQHLALVINELATNTAKHALQVRDAVGISVAISLDDHTICCEYRDDGPGYPEDVLRLERRNVGFDLIQTIVQDGLRGDLTLRNDKGAVTLIRFSAQVIPREKE